jgi:hypothetical protein
MTFDDVMANNWKVTLDDLVGNVVFLDKRLAGKVVGVLHSSLDDRVLMKDSFGRYSSAGREELESATWEDSFVFVKLTE